MRIIQYVIAGAITLAATCFGADAQARNSVRNIDFRNFTYEPSCSPTKATVTNGKFDSTDPDEPVHFFVSKTQYGDLDGSGQEQAVILTYCNLGGTGDFSEAFVFGLYGDKPTQIASIRGGDRAKGGIESIHIEGHRLKVTRQYGVALCCAIYGETITYRLSKGHLIEAGNPTRLPTSESSPIKSLRFEPGSTSATISGTIMEDYEQYSLRVRAKQVLEAEPLGENNSQPASVEVIAPDGNVLQRESNGGHFRFLLPLTGVYELVVFAQQRDTSYRFKITIR